MLALATGWTPDVLADLPHRFRVACHWALFARALVPEDGLPSLPAVPANATPDQRLARAKASASVAQARLRLFPAD